MLLGKPSRPTQLAATARFGGAATEAHRGDMGLELAGLELVRALRASLLHLHLVASAGQSWLALRAGVLRRAISSWVRRPRTDGALIRRRAGGATRRRRGSASAQAPEQLCSSAPMRHNRTAGFHRRPALPNMSFNRSSNGMAPWPCDRLGPSSAARPGRHAVVARLTLR